MELKNKKLYWVKDEEGNKFIARYYESMILLHYQPGFEYSASAYPLADVEVLSEATEKELEQQIKELYG